MSPQQSPQEVPSLIYLGIDQFHISTDRHPVHTVLGSCVSIIIADPHQGVFGVNHFLTPATGRPLCLTLLGELQAICSPSLALIVGGSHLFGAAQVGEANVHCAREFVGGASGRTLLIEMPANHPTIKVRHHELTPERRDNRDSASALEASRKAYEMLEKMTRNSGK